jgi:hypothetical protein
MGIYGADAMPVFASVGDGVLGHGCQGVRVSEGRSS